MEFVSYGQVLNACGEKKKSPPIYCITDLLSYKQTNSTQKEFIPALPNHLTDSLIH
jgi:hypothetical protein